MKDIRNLLLNKLVEYNRIDNSLSEDKKKEVIKGFALEEIPVQNYNILKVRDALYGLGTILEEDLDNQFYITTVRIGSIGAYEAVAIVSLENDKVSIAAYAKEGLISQNNAQKAIKKIKTRIK